MILKQNKIVEHTVAKSYNGIHNTLVFPVAEEITQLSGQVKMGLISQLIKGISRVPQKLLKCFKGSAILTSFILPAAGVFPVT